MKKYDLRKKAEENNGEYVFGSDDTGSHACYMIYGMLKPGEKGRTIRPGRGHEEMLLAASGDLRLSGAHEGILEEGSAIHMVEEQTCSLENPGKAVAVYVLSGGHSGHGHGH